MDPVIGASMGSIVPVAKNCRKDDCLCVALVLALAGEIPAMPRRSAQKSVLRNWPEPLAEHPLSVVWRKQLQSGARWVLIHCCQKQGKPVMQWGLRANSCRV